MIMHLHQFESAFPWWLACGPLVALPTAALLLSPSSWPRWALMWLLAFSIYFGCKWLTLCRALVNDAPLWRQAAYLLLWPGMDATAFLSPSVATGPAPCKGMVACPGQAALGRGDFLRPGAVVALRIPVSDWVGRHVGYRLDAAFRVLPPGKLGVGVQLA